MQSQTLAVEEAATQKYLSFRVGEETYGLSLIDVQEIRSYTPATRIPNSPPHVIGVMNLRGAIIAVIDLRERLGLPPLAEEDQTIVVIVDIHGKTVGLRGDSVSDVVEIPLDDVKPPPMAALDEDVQCVSGLADVAGRVIILLDPEKVTDSEAIVRMVA
jgi:purine-binding chemotaxis protein CheW